MTCMLKPQLVVQTMFHGLQLKGNAMPKVGKKKFAYTKKGKADAKKAAKKTGKKVKRSGY